MSATEFTVREVFQAYKKVKHYFYFDNTSLFIRQRIAEFERNIEANKKDNQSSVDAFWEKMEALAIRLNEYRYADWKQYFEANLECRVTAKSFVERPQSILTNKTEEASHSLQRVNIFIDASVEIHIISVLWLKYAGKHLAKLIDKDNYAYKLELTEEEDGENLVGGLRIYKPYFIQYQNWRDKAILKAEQLLEEKRDFVILSLDIKDYFNSVKINLNDVKKELLRLGSFGDDQDKIDKLFLLLEGINLTYTTKVKKLKNLPRLLSKESILPIGLLSSGILGNLYLNGFDKQIKESLNPAYYGRYVDDILMVLTNVQVEENAVSPVNAFLTKYFVKREIFSYENIEEMPELLRKKLPAELTKVLKSKKAVFEYSEQKNKINDDNYRELSLASEKLKFSLLLYPSLKIQSSKVVLQEFDHRGSPAILNKFKKNIAKNRSEFRYLPDEDKVDTEFDEEAFSLQYNDSVNKIRSIKEFSEDKYGASKYLTGKIFASSMSDEENDKNTTKQILTFFKGVRNLSFYTLWEKVATYFIINNQVKALSSFYFNTNNAINRMRIDKYDKDEKDFSEIIDSQTKVDLLDYLHISIATPLAFNPSFIKQFSKDKTMGDYVSLLLEKALAIRDSNLLRQSWVGLPCINFTKYAIENNKNNNLLQITDNDLKTNSCSAPIESNIEKDSLTSYLELDERLKFLSPRYVNFHEVNILEIFKNVHSTEELNSEAFEKFENLLMNAFDNYWKLNNEWKFYGQDKDYSNLILEAREKYFTIEEVNDTSSKGNSGNLIKVKSNFSPRNVNKKIALANIKVDPENIKSSYLGRPNTGKQRRQNLFKLINLVERERCEMFILPEVSIPYKWISLLAYQSSKRNLGIIAGLEHWVNQHCFAFNFMVTILPIKLKERSTCLIKLRLKNHYSHEEKRNLKGYRLLIPTETTPMQTKKYDLFHWNKSYFSVYNCFELADIHDRSLFKSKVDFIVASEYNKDTNYFSDIAGAWVRDIHCYFIQVNSSDYGDSRVIQPSQTSSKNILQIKGGDNSTIIVGRLDIRSLREFQLKEYELQRDDKTFKPTPPEFDRIEVQKRIDNI